MPLSKSYRKEKKRKNEKETLDQHRNSQVHSDEGQILQKIHQNQKLRMGSKI